MKLSKRVLERAIQMSPELRGPRIVLDPRGIHHRVPPSRGFTAAVTHHADQRKIAVAESLCVDRRLGELKVIGGRTDVRGQGAVFQAFRGTGDRQACHTLPCQLVLDHRYPHQLLLENEKPLAVPFITRTIEMFARCTWSPRIVNPIDQALDWTPEADFVEMYLDSVRHVLSGETPLDAYRELSWRRTRVLARLNERVRDEPLNATDAMVLLGALSIESEMGRDEIERLLRDEKNLEQLQTQREIVVNIYTEREQVTPLSLETGELDAKVNNEPWTSE